MVQVTGGAVEIDAVRAGDGLLQRPAHHAAVVGRIGLLRHAVFDHVRVDLEVDQNHIAGALTHHLDQTQGLVSLVHGPHHIGVVAGVGAAGAVLHAVAAHKADAPGLAAGTVQLAGAQIGHGIHGGTGGIELQISHKALVNGPHGIGRVGGAVGVGAVDEHVLLLTAHGLGHVGTDVLGDVLFQAHHVIAQQDGKALVLQRNAAHVQRVVGTLGHTGTGVSLHVPSGSGGNILFGKTTFKHSYSLRFYSHVGADCLPRPKKDYHNTVKMQCPNRTEIRVFWPVWPIYQGAANSRLALRRTKKIVIRWQTVVSAHVMG